MNENSRNRLIRCLSVAGVLIVICGSLVTIWVPKRYSGPIEDVKADWASARASGNTRRKGAIARYLIREKKLIDLTSDETRQLLGLPDEVSPPPGRWSMMWYVGDGKQANPAPLLPFDWYLVVTTEHITEDRVVIDAFLVSID